MQSPDYQRLGIGRAVAIAGARGGADVPTNYLPAEAVDAKEVIALIKKEDRRALAISGDLRDEACGWWPKPCAASTGSILWSATRGGNSRANPSSTSRPNSSTEP